MFKFLKEKLENWTKKISKETKAKEIPKPKTKPKKKEIIPPMKFNVGAKKYEPDLEKLEETIKKTEEKESFFKKIKTKVSKIKISEKDFEIYAEELEMLLLENNVALEVTEKIIQKLKEKIIGKELLKKELEEEIKEIFKEIIREILIAPPNLTEKIKEKLSDQSKDPYVILFCGINGSGKTTTIAKIAENLKNRKISCVLAAADTFRAASIEQIKEHGKKVGVRVISHEYGADPTSVAFDAIKYAKKSFIDCVLIDTAGRMHTEKNLLKEIEKITRVCKPDLKIFVGESITGNDAIEQVKSFDWSIGIDGIVLTKADIDEKGGTSLSVGYVTKKPIYYLGTGQAYDKIEPFDKEKFIKRLGL
ncbi:signal recognition particle-docking protein FtsY [Candidatus Pacearchaeota archaeon]|nr:signal recognition particle-docking protein FtsY [Candidatus Pacearchaeota archaeon]